MLTDTIVAISTGNSNSGINIIRVSGINAKNIVSEIFTGSKKLKHQKIIYGNIIDKKTNRIIDEVLVSYFKAPNSYTGEEVCEINCHGGRKITSEILKLIIKDKRVRMAEPGEFSKIAFLNGKMDLSKAEAIIDIINAKTKLQTDIASAQIQGSIKQNISKTKENLVETIANIEVGIDYPEYEYEELNHAQITKRLNNDLDNIQNLLNTYDKGKYIKNGINVGIIGSPNSGKSSLLNMLSKQERAIVTEIEGTTRDIIEEKVILGDIELNIFDTAGIRESKDLIETIGIKKSIEIIDKMDIILFVIDCTKELSKQDEKIIKMLDNKKHIACLNKKDLLYESKIDKNKLKTPYIIEISAKTGEGIKELEQMLNNIFNTINYTNNQELVVINERHKELLTKAKKNIQEAIADLCCNKQIDLIDIHLKEALENINGITGESASEEVIKRIFERFCLGK